MGGVGVSFVCFPCSRCFGCPSSLALFLERLSWTCERVGNAVLCQICPSDVSRSLIQELLESFDAPLILEFRVLPSLFVAFVGMANQ